MKHLRSLWISILLQSLLVTSGFAEDLLQFQINGLDTELHDNVQARLQLLENAQGEKLTPQQIQLIYHQAPQEIKQALEPFGYFHPQIESTLRNEKTHWMAYVTVKVGKPIIIQEIEVNILGEGKNNPAIKKFLSDFAIKHKQRFDTNLYNKSKEALFQIANDEGYVKSHFTDNKLLINPTTNTAKINLVFDTRERYYFGDVTFDSTPYAKSFLHRFVSIQYGKPFSSQKLLQFQQDMNSAANFQQVIATPDFEHEVNHIVPIHVAVKAPKSQKYNIGVGYGTLTGLRVSAGMSLRRLNEMGHHFDGQVRWSKVISGFALKYFIPGKNPLQDQWILGSNLQTFTPKNAESHGITLFGGYETKYFGIQNRLYLNYIWERFRIYDSNKTTSFMLYPSINWTYTSADNLITPHFGKSLSLTLQGAAKQLASSTTFTKADLQGKYIFMPLNFSRVILRGELGYISVRELPNLPASLRFYTGGFNSVRGYQDSSIGPGRYLSVGSIEYQHKIYDEFYGGIFFDVGRASDEKSGKYFKGEGVGLIYDSVLGPLKIYAAKALNRDKKPWSFEFSIGPEF